MGKNEMISQAASLLSMQYLLLRGSMPSETVVAGWIAKLKSLDDMEFYRIMGDEAEQKRFIQGLR